MADNGSGTHEIIQNKTGLTTGQSENKQNNKK